MSDNSDNSKLGGVQITRAGSTSAAQSGLPTRNKNEQIGKDEFLQMLVTQLKNQDPLDPMKNDQFAVNLAQFSQLEQLIKINDTLGGEQQNDVASLSGYLGTEVTLDEDFVSVKNNDGGRVRFTLPGDVTAAQIELTRPDGSVVESVDLGALNAGSYGVSLNDLNTSFGEYGIRVRTTLASGGENEIQAYASGIVTGFIPGPDAKLILGDRQVSPTDVREVNIPVVAPSGS